MKLREFGVYKHDKNKRGCMRKCKYCGEELPIMRVHRTWKEKYITYRNKFKYQCEQCKKITFISMPMHFRLRS